MAETHGRLSHIRAAVGLVLLLARPGAPACGLAARSCVFFSEIYSGAGADRVLELHSVCASTVDLGDYSLRVCYGGCPTRAPGVDEDSVQLPDGYELHPGQSFVLAHANASEAVRAALPFRYGLWEGLGAGNATDTFALYQGEFNASTVLDAIGEPEPEPADIQRDGILVGGVRDALSGAIAVRRAAVAGGNCGDWAASAGADPASSEWELQPAEPSRLAGSLGSHDGGGSPSPPPFPPHSPAPPGVCAWGCVFISELFFGRSDLPEGGDAGGGGGSGPNATEAAGVSGYDRYVELYNGCSAPIDASELRLLSCRDGCADGATRAFNIRAQARIAPRATFVLADYRAASEVLSVSDVVWAALGDGTDAIALVWRAGGQLLDQVGNMSGAPLSGAGAGWAVAGVDGATRTRTLVRRPGVHWGNCGDWESSDGSSAADSEWLVLETANVTEHRFHAEESEGMPWPPPSPPQATDGGSADGGGGRGGSGSGSGDGGGGSDGNGARVPAAHGEGTVAGLTAAEWVVVAAAIAIAIAVAAALACCCLWPRCPLYARARARPRRRPAATVAAAAAGGNHAAVELQAAQPTLPSSRGAPQGLPTNGGASIAGASAWHDNSEPPYRDDGVLVTGLVVQGDELVDASALPPVPPAATAPPPRDASTAPSAVKA